MQTAIGSFLTPDWLAPPKVRALATLRGGGMSRAPWNSFNLGDHVGDDAVAVAANRELLRRQLPDAPRWLRQVHGTRCIDAFLAEPDSEADASFTRERGVVCAVLTADCLPVLLCDDDAQVVAVAHAGWRGLAAGVIEAAVDSMSVPRRTLMAWLGPAIGPSSFEVGAEVRAAFIDCDVAAHDAFLAVGNGKWLCDLARLARQRLQALGIHRVSGVSNCTLTDGADFFSYRRDGVTGRMATCIWLE